MLTGFLKPGAILGSRCSFDEKENKDVNHNEYSQKLSPNSSSKTKNVSSNRAFQEKGVFESNFEKRDSLQRDNYPSCDRKGKIMKETRRDADQKKHSPDGELYQETPHRRKQPHERAPTPSVFSKRNNLHHEQTFEANFEEWTPFEDDESKQTMTIDVKPLTKLRLDLMPAPKEEDEY